MKTEWLELVASKEVLGLILPEELSGAAVHALEDGCDSPSLRVLAGLTVTEADEARPLLDSALAELNVRRPSKRDAVMHLARETAKGILSGATTPYEGAKQISDFSLCLSGENLSELGSFVYAASEWEDRPEDRQLFEDGIVVAARELVST